MLDSGKLSSEQVALGAWERRVAVDFGIQIASHEFLNQPGCDDVLRLRVRELNPIVLQVMSDPKHRSVDSFASGLLLRIPWYLLQLIELSEGNPVVSVQTFDLAVEPDPVGVAHLRKSLNRSLNQNVGILAEADSRPFKHLCVVQEAINSLAKVDWLASA